MTTLLQKMLIPQDKANHFTWGAIITALSYGIVVLVGLLVALPVWVYWSVLVPGVFFAAAKEYRDRSSGKGTPELKDFLYTIGGVLVVYLPIVIKR